MRRILSVFVMSFVLAAPALHAQASIPPAVQPGSRVRVAAPGAGSVTGRVVAVRGDTLRVLRDGAPDTVSMAAGQLTSLDLSIGRDKRRWRGAAIGFVAGAIAGGVLGAATYQKPDCAGAAYFCDLGGRGLDATVGAIVLGGVGAVVGALVGGGSVDRWTRLLPPQSARLDLLVPTGAGRVGVRASLRI